MAKRKNLMDEIREELAGHARLNELYQRELARLQIASQIAELRAQCGLSQADLAQRIGTTQTGVARMERSSYSGYTVSTLAKIAAAAGARLEIRLIPTAARNRTRKRRAA